MFIGQPTQLLAMTGGHFTESSPFLLLFLLGYCLAIIEGELRCYCNESSCVSTGYMCKSSVGKCFTAVDIRGEATHLTHGCLDSLPEEHQQTCRLHGDVVSAERIEWTSGHFPVLLCCTEHMCNYREEIDISFILTPKYNGTFHRGRAQNKEDGAIFSRNHHNSREEDRELWFKAAVIAVPIAGGFILVLLVLLAVHMLRRDTRRHRRFIQIQQERSSWTKAHRYISDHVSSKSAKHHHCSLFNETSRTCLPLYSYTATNSSSSHRSSSSAGCQSAYFSDILNNYYNSSQHEECVPKLDLSAGDTAKINNTKANSTLLCNVDNNNIPDLAACSTNSHSYVRGAEQVTPYSYSTDSSSKHVMPDLSVRLNKEGQNFHHFTRVVASWPCSEAGHQNLYSCMSEKSWQHGPEAVV